MSVELIFRPLEGWPREQTPREQRKRKPFKTRFDETLRQLRYELWHLDAPSAVIQVAFAERDISATTGRPRPDRSPAHPGVIVAADTRVGALKWVCDDCHAWTDNVHAIMLTLERLRLADLYGVTKRGEQYAGWKMLPGPITLGAAAGPSMTIEAAARLVAKATARSAAEIVKSQKAWREAYREAVRTHHPDRGGSEAEWSKLQEAATLLDALHEPMR